jgi:Cu(I)/Ag(I) efflux system membrane fusion protein
MVRLGQPAAVRVDAYPDKVFNGKVAFIYPTVTPETRTAKVRIELPNAQALLKPAMYARVELASSQNKAKVLAVPDSAVLDSGVRQLVLVELGAGRFEPRVVKLGMRGDGYVEVLEGLKTGEAVVVSANFLIDAESNLKAALGAFGAGAVTHRGEGNIEAVDAEHGTVTLTHGPIASLKWPAMTMDFRVKDRALAQTMKPGQKIGFDFIDAGGGEYVIIRAQPAPGGHGAH